MAGPLWFLENSQIESGGNGFSGIFKMFFPDLLNISYREELSEGFRKEMTENNLRFVEVARQDRYLLSLERLLSQFLDPPFLYIMEKYYFKKDESRRFIDNENNLLTSKYLEDANAAFDILTFLNQFRFPIQELLKIDAPDVWKKYNKNINSHSAGSKTGELNEIDDDSLINIDNQSQLTGTGPKLQWSCKPAVAGYIISELIRAGYIEPPITNGELSYAKLANICNQIFDIRSKGKPTTLDYLKKVVNPESNTLSDNTRAKLQLPDLDQLS